MADYIDKRAGSTSEQNTIASELKKEFKNIDTSGMSAKNNDKKEIYQAAIKVINKYMEEMKTALESQIGNNMRRETVYANLNNRLKAYTAAEQKITSYEYMTNSDNQALMQKLAHEIDQSENLDLKYFPVAKSTSDVVKARKAQEKLGKIYFKQEKGLVMKLTNEVNQPSIHEVFKTMELKAGDVYEINYTGCTNTTIKNKMTAISGLDKLFVTYDTVQKTYVLCDRDGKAHAQRALIREGVTLRPAAYVQWKGGVDARRQQLSQLDTQKKEFADAKEKTIDALANDSKRGPILKQLQGTKLYNRIQNKDAMIQDVLIRTDERLHELIVKAKKEGYTFDMDEPFSKVWTESGVMEAHLVSGSHKKDVTMWRDEKHLGNNDLYSILDGNEGDYKEYLGMRLQALSSQYDFLETRNTLISSSSDIKKDYNAMDEKEQGEYAQQYYTPEKKQNINYGLHKFKDILGQIRKDIGSTTFTSRDKNLVMIENFIKDAIYTIDTTPHLTQADLETNILTPLGDKWQTFYTKNAIWKGANEMSKHYTDFVNAMQSADKGKIQMALRDIGEGQTLGSNNYTSDLAGDIIADHQDKMELNDAYDKDGESLQTYFENIRTNLTRDERKGADNTAVIDYMKKILPAVGTEGGPNNESKFRDVLVAEGLLPKEFKRSVLDHNDKMKKEIDSLYNQLKGHKQSIETAREASKSQTIEQFSAAKSQEKQRFLQENPLPVEAIHLLEVMESDPNVLQIMFDQSKEMIDDIYDAQLYVGAIGMMRGSLGKLLIKAADGVKNTDGVDPTLNKHLGDMMGTGSAFDFSDENAKMMQDMIAQELPIMIIAMALGTVTGGAATASILGARMAATGARGLKMLNTLKNLAKLKKYKNFVNAGKRFQNIQQLKHTTKLAKFKYALSPSFHNIAGLAIGGATYAGTSATLRGDWEDMTSTKFAESMIQGAGLIGFLKLAPTLFPGRNVTGFFSRVATEEVGINMTDRGANATLGDGSYGIKDFGLNMIMGLFMEGVMHIGGSKLNNIYNRISKKLTSEGQKIEAEKILNEELAKPEQKQKLLEAIDNINAGKNVDGSPKGKNKTSSKPTLEQRGMPRERARDQLPPRSSEKINQLKHNNTQKKAVAIQKHQSGAQHIDKSGLDPIQKAEIKQLDTQSKIQKIENTANMKELSHIVQQEQGIHAYNDAGDKQFIQHPEIANALETGNFELLNFQKGDPMLELRKKGVEFYLKEKIHTVDDLKQFIITNPKLFGGTNSVQGLLAPFMLNRPLDVQLAKFSKKIQNYPGISGSKSESGFDLKGMIDTKVKELQSLGSKNSLGDENKITFQPGKTPEVEVQSLEPLRGIEDSEIAKARSEYEFMKKSFDEAKASGIHNDYNLSILENAVNAKLDKLNQLNENLFVLNKTNSELKNTAIESNGFFGKEFNKNIEFTKNPYENISYTDLVGKKLSIDELHGFALRQFQKYNFESNIDISIYRTEREIFTKQIVDNFGSTENYLKHLLKVESPEQFLSSLAMLKCNINSLPKELQQNVRTNIVKYLNIIAETKIHSGFDSGGFGTGSSAIWTFYNSNISYNFFDIRRNLGNEGWLKAEKGVNSVNFLEHIKERIFAGKGPKEDIMQSMETNGSGNKINIGYSGGPAADFRLNFKNDIKNQQVLLRLLEDAYNDGMSFTIKNTSSDGGLYPRKGEGGGKGRNLIYCDYNTAEYFINKLKSYGHSAHNVIKNGIDGKGTDGLVYHPFESVDMYLRAEGEGAGYNAGSAQNIRYIANETSVITSDSKIQNNALHLDHGNGKVDVIDLNTSNKSTIDGKIQNGVVNEGLIQVKSEGSFAEYHKDFELFAQNRENFSSADYKNFLESQFSDIRSKSDLNQKLAYHLIGLAQMRRISSNAHADYRWGMNDSKNYAKLIQDKIGTQIDDAVLKKYLTDIADEKMLDYGDMKKIAQHIMNNKDNSDVIGQTFIDNFVGSGKRIVAGTKENPIISMENLPNGKQKRIYHQAGIVEEGDFNESGNLDGPWEGKRTNVKGDVQIGRFENGKLVDGKTINNDYFDGKKSQYGFTAEQAKANSKAFDKILDHGAYPMHVGAGVQKAKVAVDIVVDTKLLVEPILQKKGLLKTGETLSEAQILAIKNAHLNSKGGKLGDPTFSQLREKTAILSEAFSGRPDIVRCLLESGICGTDNIIYRTLRYEGDQSYIDIKNNIGLNDRTLNVLTKYNAMVVLKEEGLGDFVMDVNGRSVYGFINKYGAFEYPENIDQLSMNNSDKILYFKDIVSGDNVVFLDTKRPPIRLSMTEIVHMKKNIDIKDKFDTSIFEDGENVYLPNYEGNKIEKISGKITNIINNGKRNQFIEVTDIDNSKKILRLRRDNNTQEPLKWLIELEGISMDARETNSLGKLDGFIVVKSAYGRYDLYDQHTLNKRLTFNDYNDLGNAVELVSGFDDEYKEIVKKIR